MNTCTKRKPLHRNWNELFSSVAYSIARRRFMHSCASEKRLEKTKLSANPLLPPAQSSYDLFVCSQYLMQPFSSILAACWLVFESKPGTLSVYNFKKSRYPGADLVSSTRFYNQCRPCQAHLPVNHDWRRAAISHIYAALLVNVINFQSSLLFYYANALFLLQI